MIPLVQQHLEAINTLCREYGGLRLDRFGDAATGEFVPERSDIEFLVEYPDDYDFGPWIDRYTDLLADLNMLLGHPVRLVMAGAPYMQKPYYIELVNQTRQPLDAA